MSVGDRVRFWPSDSFWRQPGERFPDPGSEGTVVRVPPPGSLGGSVVVHWDAGWRTTFGGRNVESLFHVLGGQP